MIQAQNLRQIRLRIRSIHNTRKITKAMEMISASKLGRVKTPFFLSKPYLAGIEGMLSSLISDSPGLKNPLMEKRETVKALVLCVVTSDTGLCGTYNTSIIKQAEQFLRGVNRARTSVVAIGKEGYNYFRKNGYDVKHSYLGLYGRSSPKVSDEIARNLIDMYIRQEADEVHIAYSHFIASFRYVSTVEKLLNLESAIKPESRYIFEPSAQTILDSMASKYIVHKMRSILLEAFTAEHSARMLAMKTATDNADDLTEQLTLARNKARQFAITKEVLEIASSAEALKG